jgi:ADP-ribose pyrophosphatase YjhB (NUDIX family)
MTSSPLQSLPQAAQIALARGRSFRHCRACGSPVEYRVPPGDNAERAVCTVCATVHYENPLNVVGAIPVWGDQVLLCRRAIEPRYGLWTLPAGFLELGETLEQGAIRETLEEAGARVQLQGLYSVLSVVRVGQVHLFYRAELLDIDFSPGEESLEVALFREAEIPWDELAFRTVSQTLRWFFDDHRRSQFGLHCADIA